MNSAGAKAFAAMAARLGTTPLASPYAPTWLLRRQVPTPKKNTPELAPSTRRTPVGTGPQPREDVDAPSPSPGSTEPNRRSNARRTA